MSDGERAQLHEQFSSFFNASFEEADKIIHVSFPQKMLELTQVLENNEMFGIEDPVHVRNLEISHGELLNANANGAASTPTTKKRKLSAQAAEKEATEAHAGSGSGVVYSQKCTGNAKIQELILLVKKEIRELVGLCGKVKVWVQLSIPKIDDGTSFHTAIMEEIIKELATAEDSAFGVLDSLNKYFMSRAKLVSKVFKYPNLEDYRSAVHEIDELEFVHLKLCIQDIRNNYAVLYDRIKKNFDRLEKPKQGGIVAHMY